jgi:signal transduction histidine kinase
MSLVSIILLSALVLNSVLGLFVFLGRTKTASNTDYFVLVIFVSIWIFTNYLVDFVSTLNQAWLLSTVAYVSILGIAGAFLSFCYDFPQNTERFTPVRFLPFLLAALVGASVFIPRFVIESIVISPWTINTGPGISLLFLTFIALIVAAFTILIRKLGSAKLTQSERLQLRMVLIGSMTATVLGSVFNLLFPYLFHDYDYVRIGPIFTLIMVACIAIAIVRYQLFNIKVITTQTFAVVLCTALFVRTLAAVTLQEQLINGGLFILTLLVCIFLVRSVLKEVEQREALAIANTGQENLIHIISHQLKGYLAKSRSIFSELLTEPAYGPVPEQAMALLQTGFTSLSEGVEFTQQLLNASSVEKGTMKYAMDPCDLKSIVMEIVPAQEKMAKNKGLAIELSTAPGDYHIVGDCLQIKECVKNLIDNAIHYTREGSIALSLACTPSSALLSIKDTGVGLSSSDKEKLFTKGGRGKDSLKMNVNSTGYGLFFVKGVIDAHHGRVWAESAGPGMGSTFFVELPADKTS